MTISGGIISKAGSVLFRVLSSLWVKILIAATVIALLVYFNRFDAEVLDDLGSTWPWLLASFLLMLPPFVVVSFRFKVILFSQGIKVSFLQAIYWTMTGSFFDLAMPSSSGGDLVKAGLLVKHVGTGYRTRAVMAVAFDRVVGLLGLFLLAALVSVIGWNILEDMPARKMVVFLTIVASLGSLAIFRLAGSRRLYHNPAINHYLMQRSWGMKVKQFVATFNALREQPVYLYTALGLSVVNHVFWCASLLCIVKVVGASVDPMKGFVVFPLAIFSNIFGIAGGFGGGTVGFDLILSQLLGISNGALIGLLFQTLSALARLLGLPFYLLSTPGVRALGTLEDQSGGNRDAN
jgi:uncharacterized membrane protein YbhN (UPF0104 family)